MSDTQLTKVGPFRTIGGGGFLLPVGIINLSCAAIGLLFVAAVGMLSTSMTCSAEWGVGWTIGGGFAAGAGALASTLSTKKTVQISLVITVGVLAAVASRYVVHLVYVPYCNNPFLHGWRP